MISKSELWNNKRTVRLIKSLVPFDESSYGLCNYLAAFLLNFCKFDTLAPGPWTLESICGKNIYAPTEKWIMVYHTSKFNLLKHGHFITQNWNHLNQKLVFSEPIKCLAPKSIKLCLQKYQVVLLLQRINFESF